MQAVAVAFGISRVLKPTFEEIVRQREKQVLRVAFRMLGNWADAEDVAQEAFLRLHKRGVQFENEFALGAWIYRVTVNLCVDRVRARRPAVEMPELPSCNASAEFAAIREEEKRELMDALQSLPARERAAITLREIEGLTTAEVAAALGSSEGTVRSQVSTAIGRLRELMNRRRR